MAYSFLDHLFSRDDSVRQVPVDGIVRLSESEQMASYVDLRMQDGFVVRHDENFRVKDIFADTRGFRSRNDFIAVRQGGNRTEVFIIELKSCNYQKEKVRNQFLTGTAFLSYCRRFGIDFTQDASRFSGLDVYAVLLTNTITERRGSSIAWDSRHDVASQHSRPQSGVCAVNGHEVALEDLRLYAIPVSLDSDKVNVFQIP